ncbi:MAG: type II toxin-antitoxin system VapC family toxin [Thiohalomonadales bacterium]
MTDFVVDNSVAMRWLLETEKASDQNYAESVLESLVDSDSLVPNLWHLEAANVLLGAENRLDASPGEIESFISQLENLPIHVDPLTSQQTFSRIFALARIYKLSSYDAAYLELAIKRRFTVSDIR